jgi:hypothetical protein
LRAVLVGMLREAKGVSGGASSPSGVHTPRQLKASAPCFLLQADERSVKGRLCRLTCGEGGCRLKPGRWLPDHTREEAARTE